MFILLIAYGGLRKQEVKEVSFNERDLARINANKEQEHWMRLNGEVRYDKREREADEAREAALRKSESEELMKSIREFVQSLFPDMTLDDEEQMPLYEAIKKEYYRIERDEVEFEPSARSIARVIHWQEHVYLDGCP